MSPNAYFASLSPGKRREYERSRAQRSRSLPVVRLSLSELDEIRNGAADHPGDEGRPRTRGDCLRVPRPCPWVSCRWNLYLDVSPTTGSVKINFPEREPHEIDPRCSCALDVADRGGVRLEDIALALNMTRERARQIEERALGALDREALEGLR